MGKEVFTDTIKKEPEKPRRNENKPNCTSVKITQVDYDDLLSSAGEFGLYQKLLFMSTFPFYVYGVFVYFSQLFMTEVSPNHWCWIPELENLTALERRNLAIPYEEDSRFGYSQCYSYVANWSDILSKELRSNKSWPKMPCQNGWEFNKTEIPYPTISSEMGWVCEKDSYQATAQSIFFVGSIVGGFLIGWISDRFGRLPAAVISNMIGCIAGIGSIFSTTFIIFCICRFFLGMAYDNCMIMVYLLVLEYVAPKYRTIIANLPFAIFYTIGATLLPWIALGSGHWKTFSIATSLPLALALLAPFVMPESPRWLLSKGRVDEAIEKVTTISRINKKEIPFYLIQQFKVSALQVNSEETGSLLDVLRRPLLRRVLVCISLEYMCCMIVFDSLVRSLSQLGYNIFISFTLVSLTEFPSLVIISFILDWTGRKWLSFFVLTVSCIFSAIIPFVERGHSSVMCAVVARFAVNMAINTAFQWVAELLPTSVRGSGVSLVHISGYVATVISPFIVYLETYVPWIPLVVVGCVAGVGAILTMALPETANRDMPQTFDEAEALIRNQKFFDIPFLRNDKHAPAEIK